MPRALLNTFKALDIHLWAKSDTLKWDAPVGVMTDSLKTQLKTNKAELLALLRNKQAGAYQQDCDSSLSKDEQHQVDSEPEYTDIQLLLNMIILGDCLEKLKTIPDNSVDLTVTDPPYGLKFMGKNWDKAIPSISIWKECLRVLKPGGFAFIMSATRQDQLSRMIVNIEAAGFKVGFPSMYWTYASGFPKAHNISKSIDKKLGVEREKTGGKKKHSRKGVAAAEERTAIGAGSFGDEKIEVLTKATSPEAKKFDGAYAGFQPKPAVEVIIVAMKPCDKKTYTNQALSNGKGVTWLGDCKIPFDGEDPRLPANHIISDDILNDGRKDPGGYSRFFSLDAWADLNLQDLPEKVQQNLPFIIVPKASKKEKNAGLENLKNIHPTVKPLKLMAYLITMGSRENDIVLDPFAGSSTTCIAAKMLNRKYIGIELLPEHHEIAVERVEHADKDKKMQKLIQEAFKGVKDDKPVENKNCQSQKNINKKYCVPE